VLSVLTCHALRYVAHDSEGGHSDFAPRDQRQIWLLQFLLPDSGTLALNGSFWNRRLQILGVSSDEKRILERPEVARRIASTKEHKFLWWPFGLAQRKDIRELKKEKSMAANSQPQQTKRSIKRSAWKALSSPHKTASKFHLGIFAEHVSNCMGFLFSGIGRGSSLANVVVMDLSFRLSYSLAHVAK
jgi:hypothetical protein